MKNLNEMSNTKKCSFETALDLTGVGKYNRCMLTCCCLMILAMYMDIFGISVVIPAIACDLSLNITQQGILSAVPLIGVILSSYVWGLAADMIGRRKVLLVAMPIGFVLGVAGSMAPSYNWLAIIKFFSVTFSAAANAAAFVLMAESVPSRNRSRYMFVITSSTMGVMCAIAAIVIPVFQLDIHFEISWLKAVYRPWRLVLQIISLPGLAGSICLLFLKESPKFLLSKGKDYEALAILKEIYHYNTGKDQESYSVLHVYLDELPTESNSDTSFLRKIWNQTAPLFKPPLLKNSAILYYLLLCAYLTTTGYTMWLPTLTNAFFTGGDTSGLTFCEVVRRSAVPRNSTISIDCDDVIKPITLYTVMCYSGGCAALTILLSFLVGPLGKKLTTLLVFTMSMCSGILLLFVRIPLLCILFFYMFLYVSMILGNINTYLVELNPTHLRGMATCLTVIVARGFGFFSVQVIGVFLENHCTETIIGYIILVFSGLLVATLLPPDSKAKTTS